MTAHIDIDGPMGRIYLDASRKLDELEAAIVADPLAAADRGVLLAQALKSLGSAFSDFMDVWRGPRVNEVALRAELIYGWSVVNPSAVVMAPVTS